MKHRKKHRFTCGHLGKGQFCHRCAQAKAMLTDAQALPQDAKRIAVEVRANRLLNDGKKLA